ncbi:tail fiber domain-containing protein, partial [Candidatus Woesebacteria bacterium]|nr:tail fiber domain-containing protein [Candidatus Woesebacteria bacterium]
TIWTSGNDGSGSGLDADTLDTISSGSFLRSDTSDSFTSGTLTLDSGTTLDLNGDLAIADTNISLDGSSTTFTQTTGAITLAPASGSNLNISLATTGDFAVNTDDLYVDTSTARVGIGTTSPGAQLHIRGSGNTLDGVLRFESISTDATDKTGGFIVGHYTNAEEPINLAVVTSQSGSSTLAIGGGNISLNAVTTQYFYTAPNNTTLTGTLAMTINSSQNVGIGVVPSVRFDVGTNSSGNHVAEFLNAGNNVDRYGLLIQSGLYNATSAGPSSLIDFQTPSSTQVGSITFGNSQTNYNTTSDIRLKNNIRDTHYSLNNLLNIDVHDYEFIGSEQSSTGFIAQELYQIYPEAVTAYLDNPDKYWQVDYGKLTPLIVKSIQDQQNQINDLGVNIDNNGNIVSGLNQNLQKQNQTITSLQTSVDGSINTIDSLSSDLTDTITRVDDLQNTLTSQDAQLAQINTLFTDQQEATSSPVLGAFDDRISFIEQILGVDTDIASQSALVAETLSQNSQIASSESQLSQIYTDDQLSVANVNVGQDLTVIGNSTLGDTLIAGDLMISGEIQLTRNEINTFADDLVFQHGQVTIDTSGNIHVQGTVTAEEVQTDELTLTNGKALGSATMKSGETSTFVDNAGITTASKVFLSPNRPVAIAVTGIQEGKGFEVRLNSAQGEDIQFDWFMVKEGQQ